VINRESLVKAGLIRDNTEAVKLLGTGEVSKAFTVEVDKLSASAQSKIEAAGGKVVAATPEAEPETAAAEKDDA
jgi:large subunit ribosomal protein L15